MKNITIRIFALFVIFTIGSCYNYEEQYDGAYEDSATDEEIIIPKEVVFVAGGDVYLANQFVEDIIKIDGAGTVEVASINNNHTNVIFKRSGENILIYDIESETITEEIPDTETAIWFDYHKNNETVYHLSSEGILETFGKEVLPNNPINLRSLIIIAGGTVRGAAIMENGNIIYTVQGNIFSSTHYLLKANGTEVLDYRTTGFYYRKNLRLNRDESTIWATPQDNSFLSYYRTSSLGIYDDDDYELSLGTPGEATTNGYTITSENEITTPYFVDIPSPGGEITAIDY